MHAGLALRRHRGVRTDREHRSLSSFVWRDATDLQVSKVTCGVCVCVLVCMTEVAGQDERDRGAVVVKGGAGRWKMRVTHFKGEREKGEGKRDRKTPLFFPGGRENSEPGCHVGCCLHLQLPSPEQHDRHV